jgi:integrase
MASIREHHGQYQVQYRDPSGRQRARSFARKSDTKSFAAAVETDKRRSEWLDPRLGKIRSGSYATQWLATKGDLRPRPRRNVEGRVRNHILPTFADRAIASIQPAEVRAWIAGLTAKGLAPATVRATYLTREASQEEMHFLTASQIERLAEAITPRFRVAIYAAGYLGLRDGELWAVRTTNLRSGTLRVERSLAQVRLGTSLPPGYSEIRPGLVLGPTKTGRSRSLLVPRFLLQMLDEHLAVCPPTAEGLVFTAGQGGPVWHRNFYRRHFQPAVIATGLPDNLRFHDLRHSCAALLVGDGRHIEEVKQYLGHSSIRVTSDRYGHLFPTAKEGMREGLEGVFASGRKTNSEQSVDQTLTRSGSEGDDPTHPRDTFGL